MTEDYVCTLDDASLMKAAKELNEDPKERDSAVQTLREWLQQQKWLRTPTDSPFLLAFLRTRKFSQLAARTSVEKYWTIRSENKDWFDDIDPADPKIQAFLKLGVFVLLPGRDKYGQKMAIERPDNMINELMQPEVRARIKAWSSCQYGVDLSMKPKDDAPAESFRKLNVD
ncbi:hypothetical protein ScPMuIL_000615 [Solemya velum]